MGVAGPLTYGDFDVLSFDCYGTLIDSDAGIVAAAFAIPAVAHHSFAMFDAEKIMTLEGTVKEFQWTNPHAWILLNAPKDGAVEMKVVDGSLRIRSVRTADHYLGRDASAKLPRPLNTQDRGAKITLQTNDRAELRDYEPRVVHVEAGTNAVLDVDREVATLLTSAEEHR